MLSEDFHKSMEGFLEKNPSESGDFSAGCGRLWIHQQNVILSTYWGIAITLLQLLNDPYIVVISSDSGLIQRL